MTQLCCRLLWSLLLAVAVVTGEPETGSASPPLQSTYSSLINQKFGTSRGDGSSNIAQQLQQQQQQQQQQQASEASLATTTVNQVGMTGNLIASATSEQLLAATSIRRAGAPVALRDSQRQLDSLRDIDCFGRFSKWDECSSTCGQGVQQRTFKVLRVASTSDGGKPCDLPDGYVHVKKCGSDACFAFQTCRMPQSVTSFKSLGPPSGRGSDIDDTTSTGTRIFTNATDLLIALPSQFNPRGEFDRLLLWKDWDKLPESDGALPAPPPQQSQNKNDGFSSENVTASKNEETVGSDHMAPLAGYYDRTSLASESLWFTSESMKRWKQQPRPKPSRAWIRYNRKNWQSRHNQFDESSKSDDENGTNLANAYAVVQSHRITLDCTPGLVSTMDGGYVS
mgnify:CR=1 FL=1